MTVLVTGGVRFVNLGRLNPVCAASRHGTYLAYEKDGCRCPHAREAHRLYQKRSREGRLIRVAVDATGTRRRIQALWAIGHRSQEIAEVSGLATDRVIRICRTETVMPATRDAIVVAYRRLSVEAGTSARTRARAAVAGYPTPVRWGADIDDPRAVPDPDVALLPESDCVDMVAVERALQGSRMSLNQAEEVAALRLGVERGELLTVVSKRLGINYDGAKTLLAGGTTPGRAKRARLDAEVLRNGHLSDRQIAETVGVQPPTVAAARVRLAARQPQRVS